MRTLLIQRLAYRDDGTPGVLLDLADGLLSRSPEPFALTLEPPWRDNTVGRSCIPVGTYLCRRVQSPKFGNTFEITGVPGRTHVLFHKGNIDDNTEGCVLVGEEFARWSDGSVSIMRSGPGFTEFLDRLAQDDSFMLRVIGPT